ncbi:GntR family transcriptional regulator [Sinobaca qinghaiensis]|uniref:GntR family transcriptional regulator n=1 Tax=Sinobaca qinghaiensis TaxID=342944 RepID=A0A419V852_9BACL|nr:GntR family transcriptional regulator [Sinobaca qinghaiensis]RKD76294.1 GntR family transcriptional regulator [Sinobaca qinghaiensis]
MERTDTKKTNQTSEDLVTETLRTAILDGEFQRGDRIVQEDWAKRLQVSRMPIREALKRLEFEGLVKNEPRRGAIVYPISINDIEEIYTLRSMNESIAVEKALPYLEESDFEEMDAILTEMETMPLTGETFDHYSSLNQLFHKKLMEKCPWKRVLHNTEILRNHYLAIKSPMILTRYTDKAKMEHRQILAAARSGEATLLKKMVEYHIERNKIDLIQNINL